MTTGPENRPHISVCICTYKRPQLLRRLLEKAAVQHTDGLFTYSIVVADNDCARSAEPVVSDLAAASAVAIRYGVEPRRGIGAARNRAIRDASGDFIAFIDDDEFPADNWLVQLFRACSSYKVDGVLGPVKRHFDEKPPGWLLKSRFYSRRAYPTGTRVEAKDGRTGNALFKKEILPCGELPFRPELHRGEDKDFFTRMVAREHVFIWCDEAVVYETVPPERWSRRFILKRAFTRGYINAGSSVLGVREVVKSIVAIPLYAVALPFALILGQHRFMGLSERLAAHLGGLLALVGLNPVKSPYATD